MVTYVSGPRCLIEHNITYIPTFTKELDKAPVDELPEANWQSCQSFCKGVEGSTHFEYTNAECFCNAPRDGGVNLSPEQRMEQAGSISGENVCNVYGKELLLSWDPWFLAARIGDLTENIKLILGIRTGTIQACFSFPGQWCKLL